MLNQRRDGTSFYNEVRLAPIPDQDGELPYYLGLLTDVSERVLAEQQLASAQALHSSVFNVVAEGILVLQPGRLRDRRQPGRARAARD